MRTFLGLAPGAHGAVAALMLPSGGAEVADLPPSLSDLCDMLRGFVDPFAALELIQPMPKFGARGNYQIGQRCGELRGILTALEIPFVEVRPQDWQKVVFRGEKRPAGKAGKAASRAKAQAMWPQLAHELRLVKHDGRADALHLAEYARRLQMGVAD
jgi:hypothetical protein